MIAHPPGAGMAKALVITPPGASGAKALVTPPTGVGRTMTLVVTDAVMDGWRHGEAAHKSLGLQCMGMKLGMCFWGYRLEIRALQQGTLTLCSPAFALFLYVGPWFSFMALIMKSCLW